ncbi:MAG: S8 family serine peptidase [Pseudomonadota bacterium]
MTFAWTGWTDDPSAKAGIKPYLDWLKLVSFDGKEEKDDLSIAPLPLPPMAAKISGRKAEPAALPNFARPTGKVEDDPLIRLTWMPDADNAIVGVIDSGIALSHARFRRLDGGTRFLSAWLMGGTWREESAVPFGRELFRTEIDQLMFRAVSAGAVDEADFDRRAEASQFASPRGDRRLENNATHGTMVADLAAGYDLRHSYEDEHRRRLPIIGVGLPPNSSMGASGNFLEFYALHAVEYIIDRADRIWKACDLPEGGAFPIIINLSYGLQAGPKDGHLLIEQVIRAINKKAEKSGRPIRVILPAGNDLLSEGCAKFDFHRDRARLLDWRLRPEDQTPNFAELWSDELRGDVKPGMFHPVALSLRPPTGPASDATPGKDGQMNTLELDGKPVARIYCRAYEGGEGWHRMSYVLCTAPTLRPDRDVAAPAGAWTWTVTSKKERYGYAYVQSDQSLTYGSNTGLVSTFAHPDFEYYDEFGRAIDVASYGDEPPTSDDTPPMRRRGTLNTIASLAEARVIGSYRTSDGRPSHYSSAGAFDAVGDGRETPTCVYPGEGGPSLFGLMGAGSKSGSAALMNGTSFSTALATRAVSQAMLTWMDNGRVGDAPGTEAWFCERADEDELQSNWPGGTVREKTGCGRVNAPETGRLRRAPERH